MYAIKSTIPVNELTFENVVERYQRCNATEWGQVVTLGPDEADTLIRPPSATRVVAPRPEEKVENSLAQVVTEVMNRSIGAQEQMAQAMQTQSYQMARLIGTVSTNSHPNSHPIPVVIAPMPTSVFSTLRQPPRIVPVATSSGESSGRSSFGPHLAEPSSSSGPMSSGAAELRPAGPKSSGSRDPREGADRQGRNVSFQPREFVPTYRNTTGRHCFRCGSTDHIATRCPPGTIELSTQEQQRLRQEWLTRTGRTAASVAHAAISEEDSDLESVEADSHIPGWDTRRTPGARMAQPADGTYDSESDGRGPEQGDWHWAFDLGVAAARAARAPPWPA